ncbi:hypothetical protein L1887_49912 [Cichorium endivia]|nr:hypothetical protein L1887_49912 [Cichorium endivia]
MHLHPAVSRLTDRKLSTAERLVARRCQRTTIGSPLELRKNSQRCCPAVASRQGRTHAPVQCAFWKGLAGSCSVHGAGLKPRLALLPTGVGAVWNPCRSASPLSLALDACGSATSAERAAPQACSLLVSAGPRERNVKIGFGGAASEVGSMQRERGWRWAVRVVAVTCSSQLGLHPIQRARSLSAPAKPSSFLLCSPKCAAQCSAVQPCAAHRSSKRPPPPLGTQMKRRGSSQSAAFGRSAGDKRECARDPGVFSQKTADNPA